MVKEDNKIGINICDLTNVMMVHIFHFSYVGYPGKLFLNMLKCLIIPLVVPSLIASIGSLDFRMSGKV